MTTATRSFTVVISGPEATAGSTPIRLKNMGISVPTALEINMAITSSTHIANVNPIRYRGYYYDTEISLYYLKSRYYDPQVKRFLNADGYVQTGDGLYDKNMFAYCLNNPVNSSDPTGKFAWIVVGALVFSTILQKDNASVTAFLIQ